MVAAEHESAVVPVRREHVGDGGRRYRQLMPVPRGQGAQDAAEGHGADRVGAIDAVQCPFAGQAREKRRVLTGGAVDAHPVAAQRVDDHEHERAWARGRGHDGWHHLPPADAVVDEERHRRELALAPVAVQCDVHRFARRPQRSRRHVYRGRHDAHARQRRGNPPRADARRPTPGQVDEFGQPTQGGVADRPGRKRGGGNHQRREGRRKPGRHARGTQQRRHVGRVRAEQFERERRLPMRVGEQHQPMEQPQQHLRDGHDGSEREPSPA